VIGRLVSAVAVLFGVVSVTFALLHFAGDPLAGLIPPGAVPDVEAGIRHAYGLDRPVVEQYVDFLPRAMRGDFGESWRQRRPALTAVLERLPATLAVTAVAIALALTIGGLLGLASAVSPGSGWTVAAVATSLLGQAIPAFWMGTMLILVFAVQLRWLPSSGLTGPAGVVLPALSLAAFPAAALTRLLRAAMHETLTADYMRTARAKGLTRRQAVLGHGLRNAALPALAFTGVQAGFLLGGAVIVEGVFAYPGVGTLALDAVSTRDIPLVGAFVWVMAVCVLGINFITSALAGFLDPRLRDLASKAGSAHS
jgi:peptide/nickel transport system permease protein